MFLTYLHFKVPVILLGCQLTKRKYLIAKLHPAQFFVSIIHTKAVEGGGVATKEKNHLVLVNRLRSVYAYSRFFGVSLLGRFGHSFVQVSFYN